MNSALRPSPIREQWNGMSKAVKRKQAGPILCIGNLAMDAHLPDQQDKLHEQHHDLHDKIGHIFDHTAVKKGKKTDVHNANGYSASGELPELWERHVPSCVALKNELPPHYLRLGGGAGNTARALGNLGEKAYIIANIDAGEGGDVIEALMEREGISREFLTRAANYGTTLSFYWNRDTAVINRLVGVDPQKEREKGRVHYDDIVLDQEPAALMVSCALDYLVDRLQEITDKWSKAPVFLLGSTKVEAWSLEESKNILAHVNNFTLNVDELIGLLKNTGILPANFKKNDADLHELAQAAGQLAKFLPEYGVITASGGGGRTLMIAQDGTYAILPPPSPSG